MRYHEIIYEAITNQPNNITLYLSKHIKNLQAILERANKAKQVIQDNERDGGNILEYCLRYVTDHRPVVIPSTYEIDLSRYKILDLIDSLISVQKFGRDRFNIFVDNILERITKEHPISNETMAMLKIMDHAPDGFAEYGFAVDDTDTDYQAALKMSKAYSEIYALLPPLDKIIANLKRISDDYGKRLNYTMDPHKYRPDHEPREVLYHASLYASQIISDGGFKAEKPLDRLGLGNYGDQPNISFTHDLKIAQDIMRTMRDYWMIVHGQTKYQTIINWAKVEKLDVDQMEKLMVQQDKPKDTVEQTMRLFRGYMAFTKLRSDPVLVDPQRLIPVLRSLPFKSIGVISCEVMLDDETEYLHAETEYLHAEKEFRVHPSKVVPGTFKRVFVTDLKESLTNPLPFTWSVQTERSHVANFEIDDISYWVKIFRTTSKIPPTYNPIETWVISFGIESESSKKLHGHEYGIMKPTAINQQQHKVLSTVLAAIDDFVLNVKPPMIWFSDTDHLKQRARLYQKFAQHLVDRFHYQFDEPIMQHFSGEPIWCLKSPD